MRQKHFVQEKINSMLFSIDEARGDTDKYNEHDAGAHAT
jgi:hypothetical protein